MYDRIVTTHLVSLSDRTEAVDPSTRFSEREVNGQWYVIDSLESPARKIEMPSPLNCERMAAMCRRVLNAMTEIAKGYDVVGLELTARQAIEDQPDILQEFLWVQMIQITIIQPDRYAPILPNLVA